MRDWTAERVAAAAGARLLDPRPGGERLSRGPSRAVVDSRAVDAGDLFVGLRGARANGGGFAAQALGAGAWGVLVDPEHAEVGAGGSPAGAVLVHPDPLRALQQLARAWRAELSAGVVAITGSTGKTSTKDILAALLAPALRTAASAQNLNTEIGLPLAILAAPPGTQALVLELAMRGSGQIAELTAIADPDVGVIVNVGPVHLELLGSVAAVAAAKAELLSGMRPGTTAVLPSDEPLLRPHVRGDQRLITFGERGDVRLASSAGDMVLVELGDALIELRPSFAQTHNLRNLLAAVAAARALGVTPSGRVDVAFSALRGERVLLPGGIVLINDCYNANPMSMRAALDDLSTRPGGRRLAVLGDMLELGPSEWRFHREIGAHAARSGVDVLITVGPLASAIGESFGGEAHRVSDAGAAVELLRAMLRTGDTVLVKGSRGVGLERVAIELEAGLSAVFRTV